MQRTSWSESTLCYFLRQYVLCGLFICSCFLFPFLLQVLSGDLVSDVSPGAVAAAHRRHDAVITAMLCSAPISGPAESGSTGGKDKSKKAGRYNIIGLDPSKQFLLHIATGKTYSYSNLFVVIFNAFVLPSQYHVASLAIGRCRT